MTTPSYMKPFTPGGIQKILRHLQQPAVFLNMTCGWPVLRWTAEHLSGCFGDKLIRFRLGRKEAVNTPLFETQCQYVEAKLTHFLSWSRDQSEEDVGPFIDYPFSEYWAYADYKYIVNLFQDQPSMFEDVKWSEFGFEGRNGKDSTLWIGTEGANTPCHLDSYGCNLVLQIQGRKRWYLFSPEDTGNLYPTRIPYEESSVFSQVDVLRPDLKRFPAFQRAGVHVVDLQPGQVLYVPRHWWHYVESMDPITVSVNSWIELEADDVARVSEAVTKAVVCAVKGAQSDEDDWLNPTEERVTSHNENMQYVNLAVQACAQRRANLRHINPSEDLRETPVKRDSTGQIRRKSSPSTDGSPFSVPFGPNLVPVRCRQKNSTSSVTTKDPEVKSLRNCADDCTVGTDPKSAVSQAAPDCRPSSTRSRECDGADGMSHESRRAAITTNDLLDCLLHPDVINRVTELLLERHTGSATSL